MNAPSEKPQSPLATLLLEKLAGLRAGIELLWEHYDSKRFGGETALRIAINKIWLEVSTRDPSQPYEIELISTGNGILWARGSYVRSYLDHGDPSAPKEPTSDLIDWLVNNWSAVYKLINDPTPAQKVDFETFSKTLDEARDTQMIKMFKSASADRADKP